MNITIEAEGRRLYAIGNTYPIKGALKEIGAKWDGDRRAWWIGSTKRGDLEAVVTAAAGSEPQGSGLSDDSKIVGRARYKGKDGYLILWMGRTKRGDEAAKLAFRDGSKTFWANATDISVTKRYDEGEDRYGRRDPMTLGKLNRLAKRYKERESEGYYCSDPSNRAPGGRVCPKCGDASCNGAWTTSGYVFCDEMD